MNARAVSSVLSEVCKPRIISTPFWMGTGFMKCVLMTREAAVRSVGLSGGVVEAAIFVTEMEEVLVLRMAWEGAMVASWENISDLREGISGTASMMKSAVEREDSCVVGVRSERAASAAGWVMRFLETSFARSFSVVGIG